VSVVFSTRDDLVRGIHRADEAYDCACDEQVPRTDLIGMNSMSAAPLAFRLCAEMGTQWIHGYDLDLDNHHGSALLQEI
jgi:hypothetical protein